VTPDRVVVSGIDGSLLDPVTKDYDPARPAIAALARLGVPLVLCSSRPRAEVAAAAGVVIRTTTDLRPGERLHGGGLAGLLGPTSRGHEHTEPFLLEREEDAVALAREAEARGLHVARGESFFFLCGGADKGLAVRTLLSLYEREGRLPKAIALGTWQVDLPMLRAVHRPVLLPRPGGTVEPCLLAALPHAEHARRGGPEGWNDAVLAVLTGRRLPAAA
jgi:mannosyl-3-phosphoglycerate phosphatase